MIDTTTWLPADAVAPHHALDCTLDELAALIPAGAATATEVAETLLAVTDSLHETYACAALIDTVTGAASAGCTTASVLTALIPDGARPSREQLAAIEAATLRPVDMSDIGPATARTLLPPRVRAQMRRSARAARTVHLRHTNTGGAAA